MGLQEDFEAAAAMAQTLNKTLTNEELLELYALYKQGTVGDCNTSRPGMFDQKGRYKWDGWNGKKGVNKEDAMAAYIKYVEGLVAKHGVRSE